MAYNDYQWNLIASRDIVTILMAMKNLEETATGLRSADGVRIVLYSDGSGHLEFDDGKKIATFPGCTTEGCDYLSTIIKAHKTLSNYIDGGGKL